MPLTPLRRATFARYPTTAVTAAILGDCRENPARGPAQDLAFFFRPSSYAFWYSLRIWLPPALRHSETSWS